MEKSISRSRSQSRDRSRHRSQDRSRSRSRSRSKSRSQNTVKLNGFSHFNNNYKDDFISQSAYNDFNSHTIRNGFLREGSVPAMGPNYRNRARTPIGDHQRRSKTPGRDFRSRTPRRDFQRHSRTPGRDFRTDSRSSFRSNSQSNANHERWQHSSYQQSHDIMNSGRTTPHYSNYYMRPMERDRSLSRASNYSSNSNRGNYSRSRSYSRSRRGAHYSYHSRIALNANLQEEIHQKVGKKINWEKLQIPLQYETLYDGVLNPTPRCRYTQYPTSERFKQYMRF